MLANHGYGCNYKCGLVRKTHPYQAKPDTHTDWIQGKRIQLLITKQISLCDHSS